MVTTSLWRSGFVATFARPGSTDRGSVAASDAMKQWQSLTSPGVLLILFIIGLALSLVRCDSIPPMPREAASASASTPMILDDLNAPGLHFDGTE